MLKFLKIQEEHLEQILDWRTQPDVTRYMFTDIEHSLENQKKWYQNLRADDSSRTWIISYQDEMIGVIYLSDLDLRNKRCSWGYYIGEESGRSLGGLIPLYLYNYIFHELKLNKVIAEVMAGNENVMKMHEMFGYRFVGRYENHIYKYGEYHDVFIYELLAETWNASKKYKRFVAEFE